MKVDLVDPMPLHPLLCYPGTRQPLRAVGLSSDGLPMWPLLGGDGEDDGDSEEGEEGEEGEADEDAEDTDDEGGDADKKGKRRKTGPVSRSEFDAVTNRLSAATRKRQEAEKERDALKAEKAEQERKGKPELDNVKRDLETITADHAKLQTRFKKLALENAFHTASAQEKVAWHDPKIALRSADLDDLEIDEDGNIEGIREAVKDLAKKHKYLVNSGKAEDEDSDEEKKPPRRGASGSGVGSVKTGKGKPKGTMSDEELKRRFPALGRTR